MYLLVALPEPLDNIVRKTKLTSMRGLNVTIIPPTALADYLVERSYFHALWVTATDWRALEVVKRQHFAEKVNLLILAPGEAISNDLIYVNAALWVSMLQPFEVTAVLFSIVIEKLAEGEKLSVAGATALGQLEWTNDWQMRKETDATLPTVQDGAMAFNKSASNQPRESDSPSQSPNSLAGLHIGTLNVGRDANFNLGQTNQVSDANVPNSGQGAPLKDRQRYEVRLQNNLVDSFDIYEFKQLCFEMAVDYDELEGDNKSAKARYLVQFLGRRQEIDRLIAIGKRMRPKLDWNE